MRVHAFALLIAGVVTSSSLIVQPAVAQNQQSEADKGIKTRNSGESGYVGEQDKPGSAATPPGRAESSSNSNPPSAQNSGTGISGAPGNKNGPDANQSTVGSNPQKDHVQQQDSSNVQGLPGNKSGPPAKR